MPPVAWSPDNTRIAVGFHEEVNIWEMTTQKVILTFPTYTPWESEIVWSPDGMYLAIDHEWEVKIFNALTGVEVLTYIDHSRVEWEPPRVTAIAWSPDGKRIISAYHDGGSDSTIHIWNPTAGENMVTRHTQFGRVVSTDWSPDGRRIAVAFEKGYGEVWCAT